MLRERLRQESDSPAHGAEVSRNLLLYVPTRILDTPLRNVTTSMLPAMFRDLQGKVSHSTASYTHRVLRARLNDAARQKRISGNPLDGVTLNRAAHKRSAIEPHVLTDAEVVKFKAECEGDRFGSLWTLLLYTGLRPSEALALKWNDWQDGVLVVSRSFTRSRKEAPDWNKSVAEKDATVRREWKWELTDTKTERTRVVVLIPQAKAALEKQKAFQDAERTYAGALYKDSGLIFTTRLGSPLNLNTEVPRHFKRVLKTAELPSNTRLYDLRHSCATILTRLGVNVKVISEILGHSNVRLTLSTYTHADTSMQRTAMAQLSEQLGRVALPAS